MTPEALEFLLSERGSRVLEGLEAEDLRPGQELGLLQRLRKTLSGAEAAAALTTARLRRAAESKFPEARRLFFLPEALEQATAFPLAEARAAWLHEHAPPGPVLDLGAGVGGDTLRLAARREVVAYESDPARARILRANLQALDLEGRVEVREEDWTSADLPAASAAFADPARRRAGKRVFSLHAMEPPLEALLRLQRRVPELAIKAAPGVADSEIPPGCSVDFVGPSGECREAILWFGRLAGPSRRARVWLGDRWEDLAARGESPPQGSLEPGQVLYEPEPAVIRAGALAELAERLGAHQFEPRVAWLVGETLRQDPLARAFQVEEVHRFSLKGLQRRLRELAVGRLEIKKRAFAMEPEELRRRLKTTPGGREAVVLLTRRGDEPLMVLARRADRPTRETRGSSSSGP